MTQRERLPGSGPEFEVERDDCEKGLQRRDLIETFFDRDDENAHAGFQRWRSHHWGDGYVVNYKSPNNVMLHRSPCPHLGDTDWARGEQGYGSLARSKKVCSTDRRELERWTSENATAALRLCRDCGRL